MLQERLQKRGNKEASGTGAGRRAERVRTRSACTPENSAAAAERKGKTSVDSGSKRENKA